MISINFILTILLTLVSAVYLVATYKVDLQMMQQNSYRNNRYFKWWKTNNNYASISRITDLAMLLLLISTFPQYVTTPIVIIVFLVKSIALFKKKYKKPLVFTKRVWRLFTTMSVFSLLFLVGAFVGSGMNPVSLPLCITLLAVLSWIVLTFSNWAMVPVEKPSTICMSTMPSKCLRRCLT